MCPLRLPSTPISLLYPSINPPFPPLSLSPTLFLSLDLCASFVPPPSPRTRSLSSSTRYPTYHLHLSILVPSLPRRSPRQQAWAWQMCIGAAAVSLAALSLHRLVQRGAHRMCCERTVRPGLRSFRADGSRGRRVLQTLKMPLASEFAPLLAPEHPIPLLATHHLPSFHVPSLSSAFAS